MGRMTESGNKSPKGGEKSGNRQGSGRRSFQKSPGFTQNRNTMDVSEKIRLTEAQEAKLDAGGVVVIPASWEEFSEFSFETPYRADYCDGTLVLAGFPGFWHDVVVTSLVAILSRFFANPDFLIAGGRIGVKCQADCFSHDLTIVKGQPIFWNDSIAVITNPHLVVEVLSESTYDYDVQHKLRRYEQMESLVEVVFVDRLDRSVFTYCRTETPNVWLSTIYTNPDETLRMGECSVLLREVFAGLPESA